MKQLLTLLTLSIIARQSLYAQKPLFDPSFGSKGEVVINNRLCTTGKDYNVVGHKALAFFPDGRILAGVGNGFGLTKIYPDGRPDSSFGTNGVKTFHPGINVALQNTLVQPDGRILMAGTADNRMELIRLLPDGTPDSSFNGIGYLQFELIGDPTLPSADEDQFNNVLLQKDGKYLVLGSVLFLSPSISRLLAVTRVNPDGSIDKGFGINGATKLGSFFNDAVFEGAIHPDSSITVTANVLSGQDGPSYCQAYRLKPNGLSDSSFGNNGVLNYSNMTPVSYCSQLLGTPDGKYYVLGNGGPTVADSIYFVSRFLHNGHPDSTYGINGVFTSTVYGSKYGRLLRMDTLPGGGLVILANNGSSGDGLYLTSVTAAGKLNPGFGSAGFTGLPDSIGYCIGFDPYTNKIYTFSVYTPAFQDQYSLLHFSCFNTDGTIDPAFGANGVSQFGHGGTADALNVLGITSTKKILTAGHATGCSTGPDYLALYINRYLPNGQPDNAFGVNGSIQWDGISGAYEFSTLSSLVMLPDDAFLIGGTTTYEGIYVQKRKPDGLVDSSFGVNGTYFNPLAFPGKETTQLSSLVAQPDGSILFLGSTDSSEYNHKIIIGRLTPQGASDPTFGVNGYELIPIAGHYGSFTLGNALALRPDGRIVIVADNESGFSVLQLNANGSTDPAFGVQGVYTYPNTYGDIGTRDIKLQQDGKILVLYGYNAISNYQTGLLGSGLIRLLPGGTIDSTFAASLPWLGGSPPIVANQMMLQNDGRILIPAVYGSSQGAGLHVPNFALFRLKTDGRSDNTFSPNGVVILDRRYALSGPYYDVHQIDADYMPVLLARQDSATYILSGTIDNISSDGWLSRFYAKDSVLPEDADTTAILLKDTLYSSVCRTVKLSWIARNDTASLYFSIQRTDRYGNSFTQLTTVPPISHDKGVVQYVYTDSFPLPGSNWYRIQLIMGGDSVLTSNSIARMSDTSAPGHLERPAVSPIGSPGLYVNVLSWTVDQQKQLDSIIILRKVDSGPFVVHGHQTPMYPGASNAYSWPDADTVQMGHTYTYQIVIYGVNCVNVVSDTVSISRPAPPVDTASGPGTVIPPSTDTVNMVKVYPNPAHSSLQIIIPSAFNKGEMDILSFDGRVLYKQEIVDPAGGVISLSIGWLNPGIYYLKLINTQKVWVTTFFKL